MKELLKSLTPSPSVLGYRDLGQSLLAVVQAPAQGPWHRGATSDGGHTLIALFGDQSGRVSSDGDVAADCSLLLAPPEAALSIVPVPLSTVALLWLPTGAFASYLAPGAPVRVRAEEGAIATGVRGFVEALCARQGTLSDLERRVCEQLSLAAGSALAVEAVQAFDSSPPVLLERARLMLFRRRADATFRVGDLARELAVSPRQLQRAFAAVDSSPAAELRRARAELARKVMQHYPELTRDQIAARSGFTGAQSLRRALDEANPCD